MPDWKWYLIPVLIRAEQQPGIRIGHYSTKLHRTNLQTP